MSHVYISRRSAQPLFGYEMDLQQAPLAASAGVDPAHGGRTGALLSEADRIYTKLEGIVLLV